MLADWLSRQPIEGVPTPEEVDEERGISSILLATFETRLIDAKDVAKATHRDPELSRVKYFVTTGWPRRSALPMNIRPYHAEHLTYTILNDCVMSGARVVLPESLRERFLSLIHDSHVGVVRMKTLARQFAWWPSITRDIERAARECSTCSKFGNQLF